MTLTLFLLFVGVALLSACLGLLVTALCVAAKRADEQADALSHDMRKRALARKFRKPRNGWTT